MKKRIVITGISSALMQKFAAAIDYSCYEVVGITRNPEKLELPDVKVVKGDICNVGQFARYLDNCDTIIHAAAITHSFRKKHYYRVNLEATRNIVDEAKQHGVRKFVFISSNTAGVKSGHYGMSKLLAEQYVQEQFDCWTIFRPSEIFGGTKGEGIEELINKATTKRFVLCPLGVPTPFSPVYIDDALAMMVDTVFSAKEVNETTIINGPKQFSYSEVIALGSQISGNRITILSIPRFLMFILKRLAEIVPFYVGILPDQIDRLYSVKQYRPPSLENMKSLDSYIKQLINR